MKYEFNFSQDDPETGLPLTAVDAVAVQEPVAEPPAEPVPRQASTTRDLVLAGVLALVLALLVDTLFYANAGIGMSICLSLALFAAVWYLWKQHKACTPYAVFCMVGALGLAVSMTFSDDGFHKFLAFVGCVVLTTLLPIELWQTRRRMPGTVYALGDFFSMLFVRSFGGIGRGVRALMHKDGEDGPKKRRIGSVLIGVGVAIPALAVVIALLVSSDAAFEGMMQQFDLENLPIHLIAILLGLGLALLMFCQLFSVRHDTQERSQKQPSAGRLDPVIAVSFLSLISLAYVLYLISQGAYFFDGFRGLLPEGFTVAEYARRGFFEMSAVCVLNLGFVFLAQLLTKKQEGIAPPAVQILSLFVCLFSLVLIATSISKMFLYIHSFGLTRLRILTSAFMLFLACVFVAVILRLFLRKIPYLKVAVIAATVIVLTLSFANVDRLVASYNVRAYQTSKLESIDMETLNELSDAAVPYLVELLDEPRYRDAAKAQLRCHAEMLFDCDRSKGDEPKELRPRDDDLRSFNTVEYAAKQLILANEARIFP